MAVLIVKKRLASSCSTALLLGSESYQLMRLPSDSKESSKKRVREVACDEVAPQLSWFEAASAAIQNGDAGVLEGIQVQLSDLMSAAQRRLISFKVKTGTGVVLVDSNQSQDQDVRHNMCSRSVSADFTAGPNRHPFSMSFDNENEEGEETITIFGPCFEFDEGKRIGFDDKEVEAFLTAAGLEDAQPLRASCGVTDPIERRRWVLGDVIYDAVGLVESKYGCEDNCGVGLGMGQDSAYEWLGLPY